MSQRIQSLEDTPTDCTHCDGTGKEHPDCPECEGNGWVEDEIDGGTMTCPECDNEPCSECSDEED